MAVNGAYNYNNYNTNNYNTRTGYASREQHAEYAKEQAFLKEHGLDGDLVENGRRIDTISRRADGSMSNAYNYEDKKTVNIPIDGEPGGYRIVSTDTDEGKAYQAKLIEERDKAVAEYAKYRDLLNQTARAAKEKAGGTWTYDDSDKFAYAHQLPDAKTNASDGHAHTHRHGKGKGKGKHDVASFDMDKIRETRADMSKNVGAYKQMVFNQIKSQGNHANSKLKELLKGIAGMSQEDAAKAVADDGEWGVEATANRILDFAKSISGGDPSKIAMLRDAVEKGFAAAGKVWGGELPEISQQTRAKVMEGFDEWERSANGETVAE